MYLMIVVRTDKTKDTAVTGLNQKSLSYSHHSPLKYTRELFVNCCYKWHRLVTDIINYFQTHNSQLHFFTSRHSVGHNVM